MANRERIRELVEALRSGDFQQTAGALKVQSFAGTHPCYCIEGVMAFQAGTLDINTGCSYTTRGALISENYHEHWQTDPDERVYACMYEGADPVGADAYTFSHYDLDGETLTVELGEPQYSYLHELNDEAGWTFEQFADAFETAFLS